MSQIIYRLFGNKSSAPTSTVKATAPTKREHVVNLCHWGIVHTARIHYAMARPIPRFRVGTVPNLPLWTDCSGWVTICYHYAGARDPNGLNYDGQGNTGTLLNHMKHIPIREVKPGDVVIYGVKTYPGFGHHAGIVTEVHSHTYQGIVTCSHGSEQGPMRISVDTESKYQPDGHSGIVFLSSIGR